MARSSKHPYAKLSGGEFLMAEAQSGVEQATVGELSSGAEPAKPTEPETSAPTPTIAPVTSPSSAANATHTTHTPVPDPVPAPTPSVVQYRTSIFPYPRKHLPNDFVTAFMELQRKLNIPLRFWIQLPPPPDGPLMRPTESPWSSIRPFIVDMMIDAEVHQQNDKGVGLIIHSPGGDSGAAYKLAKFLRKRFGSFTALIPDSAKSAATLLSLGASKILLGPNAELGPLDVQVFDPAERESRFSALDEVQSLERLHDSAMTAALKSVMALKGVTGKKFDVLLPMCLDFVASMWRPLFEKIDVVHWTKMSRALKVGEDYASRLLKRNHGEDLANMIAEELVKKYSEHGFVIDIDEANSLVSHPQVSDFKLGLNAEPLQPDIYALLKIMIDSIKRAEIYSIFGGLVEVKTTPPGTGEAK